MRSRTYAIVLERHGTLSFLRIRVSECCADVGRGPAMSAVLSVARFCLTANSRVISCSANK